MPYDIRLKNVVKEFTSGRSKGVIAVDNISLDIEQGEFFALLGPSGCGKTTTLRMIAGFEQPTSGSILIRDEPMEHVPPFHRPVNTVFQDYALFPHMTVLNNIMFGLKMEGVAQDEARQRALDALKMVRLPDIASRRPTQLSGGQQQRVALARALVKRPAVLLLDEPLGALDLKLRKQMQYELKSMQQDIGITFIYVTHDQEEAMTMADRIAVMSDGQVLQVGAPRDIYEQPQSRFVADFIGETNFIPGILESHSDGVGQVRLADSTVVAVQMPDDFSLNSGAVTIPIRPERIGLMPAGEQSPYHTKKNMTILEGRLLDSQYIGTDTRYTVQIAGEHEVVSRIQNVDYQGTYTFNVGDTVQVFWPLQSTHLLDH